MKVCTKCLIEKTDTNFFIRDKQTGRRHSQCKECYSLHRRTYYAAHYEKYREHYLQRAKQRRHQLRADFHKRMLDYLSDKSCLICGEDDIRVLEFDHIVPSEKRFDISQGVRLGYNWDEIYQEIAKCRILCANCHKKHTSSQNKWYKAI